MNAQPPAQPLTLPKDFAWGTATAAYQIEGGAKEGGRGVSIWDTYSHTPGLVLNGDTGDIACDHYHRYRDDVETLAALGATHYRFSIAWPRIQPDGRGPVNAEGLDFYVRLVDALLEKGIQPWVTLYHWDLPQALEDAGGWPERDTAERFADYAAAVYGRLHDRVQHWTTHNEPWCASFVGYAEGRHAPGLTDPVAALRAAHHLMLGHGQAVRALRAIDADRDLGITLNLYPVTPLRDTEADQAAATRIDGLMNRIFLDPLLRGSYPQDMLEHIGTIAEPEWIRDGDTETINAPIDVLGINCYSRHVVRAAAEPRTSGAPSVWVGSEDIEFVKLGLPQTEMGWEIDSESLYDVLTRVQRDYGDVFGGRGLRLYVTENGAAFDDAPDGDGQVHDPQRVDYLDSHVRAALRARSDGADLRGYFAWSLMDNFEWAWGYTKRFGLVYVDYTTQRRTVKDSGHWFAEVARRSRDAAAS